MVLNQCSYLFPLKYKVFLVIGKNKNDWSSLDGFFYRLAIRVITLQYFLEILTMHAKHSYWYSGSILPRYSVQKIAGHIFTILFFIFYILFFIEFLYDLKNEYLDWIQHITYIINFINKLSFANTNVLDDLDQQHVCM